MSSAEYEIDFGDGSRDKQESISLDVDERTTVYVKHIFTSPGTYDVRLTADPDDDVSETDEDNEKSTQVTIQ
jgi:subtilase family serine protease